MCHSLIKVSSQISNQNIFVGEFRANLEACRVLVATEVSSCHIIIHSKQRGIENRRKIGLYCSQMQCNDSKLHVMFRQLYLVISPVCRVVELRRLNPMQTLIFWKTPFICKYYAWGTCGNSSEIPGELSRENMISSHVIITCYFHMWRYHRSYNYIINRAFCSRN